MALYTGRCAHLRHLPRKPIPTGMKMDGVAAIYGYLFGALPETNNPLPYDETVGRIFAVIYHILSGKMTPGGHNFLHQGHVVS